jgi:2-phosphoglycerate kinase
MAINGKHCQTMDFKALITAGLQLSQAQQLIEKLYTDRPNIQPEESQEILVNVLTHNISPAIAKSYRLWREVYRKKVCISILLMGVTGVGKTEIALKLDERLASALCVPVDLFRSILRNYLSPSAYPTLYSSSYLAWKALKSKNNDRDSVVRAYKEQCAAVNKALDATIGWSKAIGKVLILEGVNISPAYVASLLQRNEPNIFPFLITVETKDTHLTLLQLRHQMHPKPPVSFETYKKCYIEITYIQDFLLQEALKFSMPILTNGNTKLIVDKILKHIEDRVCL